MSPWVFIHRIRTKIIIKQTCYWLVMDFSSFFVINFYHIIVFQGICWVFFPYDFHVWMRSENNRLWVLFTSGCLSKELVESSRLCYCHDWVSNNSFSSIYQKSWDSIKNYTYFAFFMNRLIHFSIFRCNFLIAFKSLKALKYISVVNGFKISMIFTFQSHNFLKLSNS